MKSPLGRTEVSRNPYLAVLRSAGHEKAMKAAKTAGRTVVWLSRRKEYVEGLKQKAARAMKTAKERYGAAVGQFGTAPRTYRSAGTPLAERGIRSMNAERPAAKPESVEDGTHRKIVELLTADLKDLATFGEDGFDPRAVKETKQYLGIDSLSMAEQSELVEARSTLFAIEDMLREPERSLLAFRDDPDAMVGSLEDTLSYFESVRANTDNEQLRKTLDAWSDVANNNLVQYLDLREEIKGEPLESALKTIADANQLVGGIDNTNVEWAEDALTEDLKAKIELLEEIPTRITGHSKIEGWIRDRASSLLQTLQDESLR